MRRNQTKENSRKTATAQLLDLAAPTSYHLTSKKAN
jgi:hypothetical protein